jgi:hypothetical protein
MKSCLLIGNCQMSGIQECLKHTHFFKEYEVSQYANWELLKSNERIPLLTLKNADLVIYQPLSDVHGCHSTNLHNPESFMHLLKEDCITVSFPRIHNNALFPIFHKNNSMIPMYGCVKNKIDNVEQLVDLYVHNRIDFGFEERMLQNHKISLEKERDTDIKIADFIQSNVSKKKLFLTQDHPTSAVFQEVTRQLCDRLEIDFPDVDMVENKTLLQDSVYRRPDHQYPISRYAIQHFGFKYITQEHPEADLFYARNLVDYYRRFY